MGERFKLLSQFLDEYKTKLVENKLTQEEGLLLLEFFGKSQLTNMDSDVSEKQFLNWLFIGYYISRICGSDINDIVDRKD